MKKHVVFFEAEEGSYKGPDGKGPDAKGPDGHRRDTMPMAEAVRSKE